MPRRRRADRLTQRRKLGKNNTPFVRQSIQPSHRLNTGKSLLMKNRGLDCLELQHSASMLKSFRNSIKQKKAQEEEKVGKT